MRRKYAVIRTRKRRNIRKRTRTRKTKRRRTSLTRSTKQLTLMLMKRSSRIHASPRHSRKRARSDKDQRNPAKRDQLMTSKIITKTH